MDFLQQMVNWTPTRSFGAPTHSQETARKFVERLVAIHAIMKGQKDLQPCEEVNTVFGELVSMCIQILPDETTQQVQLPLTPIVIND